MGLLDDILTADDKLSKINKKIRDLEREIKVEQEVQAKRTDPTTKPGYNYYVKELNNMPEKRNAEIVSLETKASAFKIKKEAEIKLLKDHIESYTRRKEAEIALLREQLECYTDKKEAELSKLQQLLEIGESEYQHKINTINNKRDTLMQEYTNSINRIVSTVGVPTSIGYDRKRQLLEEYEDKRIAQQEIVNELNDKRSRLMKEESQEANRELEKKARRAEEKSKEEARDRIEKQRKDDEERQQKRDALEMEKYKCLELSDEENTIITDDDLVKSIAVAKPIVNKVKLASYNGQNIKRMTLEEMDAIDDMSIPKDKQDEWHKRYLMLERKEDKKNSKK